MNLLFTVLFILCALVLCISAPDAFLKTLLDGATKSASLSFALLSGYAVWMGLANVWEESGVSKKIASFLAPPIRKLFRIENGDALTAVCMNVSANLLGVSGVATPYGIKAAQLLHDAPNAEFSTAMLFTVNATSLQLIPTSVIGVRAALGSSAPSDIVLPTLLCTVFSTAFATALLVLCFAVKQPRKRFKLSGQV